MKHWEAINEIGLDNYGIVTTDDARGICNPSVELPRWVKSGRLENVGRGVYRLSQYTPSEYDQYVAALQAADDAARMEEEEERLREEEEQRLREEEERLQQEAEEAAWLAEEQAAAEQAAADAAWYAEQQTYSGYDEYTEGYDYYEESN